MDKRLKYWKVKHLSPWGAYHHTFERLWEAVPAEAKAHCTAQTLVAIVHRLKRQWDLGAQHARTEASQDLVFYHGGHTYRLLVELEGDTPA